MKRLFLLLIAALPLVAQVQTADEFETSPLELSLGKPLVAALRSTEKVEIAGIDTPDCARDFERATALFPMKELTSAQVTTLKDALLEPDNYVYGATKSTPFVPTVGTIFHTSKGPIRVLISPIAKQVKILDSSRQIILDYDLGAEAFNIALKSLPVDSCA